MKDFNYRLNYRLKIQRRGWLRFFISGKIAEEGRGPNFDFIPPSPPHHHLCAPMLKMHAGPF